MKKILGIILIVALAGLASCTTKETSENTTTTVDQVSNTESSDAVEDNGMGGLVDDGMENGLGEGVVKDDSIDEDAMMKDVPTKDESMMDDLPVDEGVQKPSIEEIMMEDITETIMTTGSIDSIK